MVQAAQLDQTSYPIILFLYDIRNYLWLFKTTRDQDLFLSVLHLVPFFPLSSPLSPQILVPPPFCPSNHRSPALLIFK